MFQKHLLGHPSGICLWDMFVYMWSIPVLLSIVQVDINCLKPLSLIGKLYNGLVLTLLTIPPRILGGNGGILGGNSGGISASHLGV